MDHHTKTTLLAYKASQVLITRCSLPRAIISMCIYVRERERNGGIYSREEGSGSNVCAPLIKARIPRSRKPGEVNHSWIMAVLMLASCLALVASALGKWLGLYLQVMHFRIFFWIMQWQIQQIPGLDAIGTIRLSFMCLGLRVWSAYYQAPSQWLQQDC